MIKSQQFTVTDPRTFDGDPYQVAERAVRQCEALTTILMVALESAEMMARNAEMERGTPATEWDKTPQARQFVLTRMETEMTEKRLAALARSVGYNPKAPV